MYTDGILYFLIYRSSSSPKRESLENNVMNKAGIVEDIKRQILQEGYAQGQYLIERDLCEHYRVSRTPMREALFNLVNAGLVVQERGKGFSVRKPDLIQLFEIFEARESIEGIAAKLCAQRLTIEQHTHFTKLLAQLESLTENNRSDEGIQLGRKLHVAIIEAAGNEFISEFSTKLNNMARLVGNMMGRVSTIEEEARRYHLKIVESILTGSPESSERIMREHIVVTLKRLIDALYPDYKVDVAL